MICIPVCLCMLELQSPTGGSTTTGAAITWSIFGKGTWNRTDCISRLQSLFLNYNADSHSEHQGVHLLTRVSRQHKSLQTQCRKDPQVQKVAASANANALRSLYDSKPAIIITLLAANEQRLSRRTTGVAQLCLQCCYRCMELAVELLSDGILRHDCPVARLPM